MNLDRRSLQRAAARFGVVLLGVGLLAVAISQPLLLAGSKIKPLDLPDSFPPAPQTSKLYDRNGRFVAAFHGEQNRIVLPADQIPEVLKQAVIAAEDERFFEHFGLSIPAIARAVGANAGSGEVVQGASTITQQYVRNASPDIGNEATMARKIEEALTAIKVEQKWSKQEILTRYLNTVYFGRGAYGVEAAAVAFFGKHARDLTLTEAATLAGVIPAPDAYSANDERMIARRALVLRRMEAVGFISAGERRDAEAAPAGIEPRSEPSVQAAYFVEHVRRLLRTPATEGGFGLSDQEILGGGLRIHTTLDLSMQHAAEDAVAAVLDREDDPEAALVAMTTDGQIRAMVGGRHFRSVERARGFNFATQRGGEGGRQAGSTFKPFTLAAFLDRDYTAQSTFRAPSQIKVPGCPTEEGTPWEVGNYGDNGYGRLSVVRATEQSVNTVYAQLVDLVGPESALGMARDAGIVSPLDSVCSITLGVFGVTPLEMSRAYATFGARGNRPEVLAVTRIVGPDGQVVAELEPRSSKTMPERVADEINEILRRVMTNGTGRPAAIDREAAGKTGTTQNRRDVWFVGYTPHPGLSAAVWIGYPPDESGQIKPMTLLHGRPATGGGFAGKIWALFMEKALEGMPETSFASVSLADGKRASTPKAKPSSSEPKQTEPKRDPAPEPERSSEPEPEPDPEPAKEEKPSKKPKPKPREADPTPEPDPEPTDEPDPEPTDEPEPEPDPEPTESATPPPDPEPEPEPEPEPTQSSTSPPDPEPEPEPEPTQSSTSEPEPTQSASPTSSPSPSG